MKSSNKPKTKLKGIPFLFIIVAIYIILYFINKKKTLESLHHFGKNTLIIAFIFIFVILLTATINYYYPKEKITKILKGKATYKTYLISLLAGIISHGPIFAWYPLLENIKDKGLSNGAIVIFVYGKAIKLSLLPVMIGFFGQLYTIIFMIYIAIAALIQGYIYDKFFEKINKNTSKSIDQSTA